LSTSIVSRPFGPIVPSTAEVMALTAVELVISAERRSSCSELFDFTLNREPPH
jgi:hypothetical protein